MNKENIFALCPGLVADSAFDDASEPDAGNNCFAWAAGDLKRVWDPLPTLAPTRAGLYWPPGVPLLYSLSAYIDAYRTIGYEVCEDDELEEGFEKIALYVNDHGEPAHAARQLASGVWACRLGRANDIFHQSPESVTNAFFGKPAVFMKRRRT